MDAKPPRPVWTPTISFGNLVSIVTIVVTVSGSFVLLRSTAEANTKMIEKLAIDYSGLASRVTQLEIGKAADDQKFANIIQLLDRIDNRLERMEMREKP